MDHLLEITRIIDGAVKGDQAKVAAYVEQLVKKLRESGEVSASNRLNRTLKQVGGSEIAPAGFSAVPRLPVDQDSRFALADEQVIDPDSVNLILDEAVGLRVHEFLQFVKAADQLMANRVGITPSMIMYGPPGIGKTELARYIASELELPLITSRSDSLISSFLGNTARNLRLLFEHAMTRPCVLFLDEIDAIAKLRDDQHEVGELKRVVVSLLQNIDALDNGTVFLAATNHHHLLDPAIWRRFAYRLEMNPPEQEVRAQMFSLFLKDHEPEEDCAYFALVADGLSGADIKMVCENAIRRAVLRDEVAVSSDDLMRGLIRSRLGETFVLSHERPEHVKLVRDLDPKIFTCKRLAGIFGTSEPTISRRLNDPGAKNGRERRR